MRGLNIAYLPEVMKCYRLMRALSDVKYFEQLLSDFMRDSIIEIRGSDVIFPIYDRTE